MVTGFLVTQDRHTGAAGLIVNFRAFQQRADLKSNQHQLSLEEDLLLLRPPAIYPMALEPSEIVPQLGTPVAGLDHLSTANASDQGTRRLRRVSWIALLGGAVDSGTAADCFASQRGMR